MDDAPALDGLDGWVNAEPLHIRALEGEPVLLHFWRFSCIQSLKALEYVQEFREAYGEEISVVGIHTPEFPFETDRERVEAAMERLEVGHPVGLDNAGKVWERYGNVARPRQTLLDHSGRIAEENLGLEGVERIEEHIRQLLRRLNGPLETPAVIGDGVSAAIRSRIYAGASEGQELGNTHPWAPYRELEFEDDGERTMNRIHLDGRWKQEDRFLESRGDGHAAIRFWGARCNAVLAPGGGRMRVEVDGEPVGTDIAGEDITVEGGVSYIQAGEPGFRNLLALDEPSVEELELVPESDGARIYSFSFR